MIATLQALTGGKVLRVISCRLFIPATRVWFADLDLDPDYVSDAPTSGKATLTIGSQTLAGTVDPRGSGGFVGRAKVRLVAGAMGWDQLCPRFQFHNDGGVLSTTVYQATASAVGEVVNDPAPVVLGPDVARFSTSPAHDVFRERDWYVDFAGVTQVGARPPATPDASVELLDFDPLEQVGTVSADAILLPGTLITDVRIGSGSVVVGDVEQVFGPRSSRATFWTGTATTDRMKSAIAGLVRGVIGFEWLRSYQYRFVQDTSDGRYALQAISVGAPDLNPIAKWSGLSGSLAKLAPATVVIVAFTADDPPVPYVASYNPLATPIEQTVDAAAKTHIGPSSAEVDIGDSAGLVKIGGAGAGAVIPSAFWSTEVTGLLAVLGKLAGALTTGGIANTLVTDLAALPSPATNVGKIA